MQTTSHILMIRPVNFTYNQQTAVNNAFQVAGNNEDVQERALKEFNDFTEVLLKNGVDVITIDDTPEPHTPDSIFPNNWISFHEDGTVVLYPMYAENRRHERKPGIIDLLKKRFIISRIIDLSKYEKENKFLEGTGSMVLDRNKKLSYACLSPRTHVELLDKFCALMNYQPVVFKAVDLNGAAIYHTNVMMCVAEEYIVICLDSIPDKTEREKVIGAIKTSGKELISIDFEQMNHFAGNMLQVENNKREKLLVMSTQSFNALTDEQVKKLQSYNTIIHSSLDVIESNGGGSARCMMAEVHLPIQTSPSTLP